jgi:hypothetical protein
VNGICAWHRRALCADARESPESRFEPVGVGNRFGKDRAVDVQRAEVGRLPIVAPDESLESRRGYVEGRGSRRNRGRQRGSQERGRPRSSGSGRRAGAESRARLVRVSACALGSASGFRHGTRRVCRIGKATSTRLSRSWWRRSPRPQGTNQTHSVEVQLGRSRESCSGAPPQLSLAESTERTGTRRTPTNLASEECVARVFRNVP